MWEQRVRIYYTLKVLNNYSLVGDLLGGVITMPVVVRPPLSDKKMGLMSSVVFPSSLTLTFTAFFGSNNVIYFCTSDHILVS